MSFWRNLSSDFHPGSVPEGWERSQSLLEPPEIRCRTDPILPIWGGLEIRQETPLSRNMECYATPWRLWRESRNFFKTTTTTNEIV